MTTSCKIVEITPPITPPAPADRTFTITLTGQELQHLRASMGNQEAHKYVPILGECMLCFFSSLGIALEGADIPVLSYPDTMGPWRST